MIKLTDDLYYDEDKTFDEQLEDVQSYVLVQKEGAFSSQDLDTEGNHTRPTNYNYDRSGYTIVETFNHRYSITDSRFMLIYGSTITVIDRVFHYDKPIRVKQDSDSNALMLKAYPSLLEYAEANNILTVVEKGYVYTYCEFLLDQHRALFEAYNGLIQNKI